MSWSRPTAAAGAADPSSARDQGAAGGAVAADHDPGHAGQRRDRVGALLFGLLTAFIVGYYWLPSVGAAQSTPHNLFFWLLFMPLFLVLRRGEPWRTIPADRLAVVAMALIVFLGATALWALPYREMSGGRALLDTVATATFVVAVRHLLVADRLRTLAEVVVGAAVAVAAVSMVSYAMGHGHYPDRLSSAIHDEHPNLFGHYLGVAAIVALARWRERQRWRSLVAVAVLWVAVILTEGRTVGASLVVGSSLVVVEWRHLRRLMAAALLAAAVLLVPLPGSGTVGNALLGDYIRRGDAGRDVIYRTIVRRALARPWFGSGLTAYDDVEFPRGSGDFPTGFTILHPHSVVVATFYYGGAAGLALLVAVAWLALRRGVRRLRCEDDRLPIALLVFGCGCLLPDGHHLVSAPHLSSWLLFWLPVALLSRPCEPAPAAGQGGSPVRAG